MSNLELRVIKLERDLELACKAIGELQKDLRDKVGELQFDLDRLRLGSESPIEPKPLTLGVDCYECMDCGALVKDHLGAISRVRCAPCIKDYIEKAPTNYAEFQGH